MQVEATGDSNAPDQQEVAGDSEAPNQQEYNKALKELEDEEEAEAESALPKQILATIIGLE